MLNKFFGGAALNTNDQTGYYNNKDELKSLVEALNMSQAVIQFKPDGTIISANKNFLDTIGYELSEITGRNHSMFVDPSYKESAEYKIFWQALSGGQYQAGEFKRIGKGGKEIWIHGSYNPIIGKNGEVTKIVKYASDVTEQTHIKAESIGQIEAIGKVQAVIEFDLDGTIIKANDNFLKVMGYQLNDIKGKHHSMFIDPAYASSPDYKQFWQSLNQGEFQAGEFMRLGKDGKEVWIQASYNPIFAPNGQVFKVVKFATDITEQKLRNADFSGQIEAIGKSQAVIEFDLDGTIIKANDNFLNTMEYFCRLR